MEFQPHILADSMRYSLQSGGKRVRPVLFFGALDAFGADYRREARIAAALECIHTYSLIHDDLPAMDNDDFRRGRPSNHKVFGEANAILAGDALLSFAYDLLLAEGERDALHLRAARRLSLAAGADGMIAGQSADLLYGGKEGSAEDLLFIYRKKTAALVAAPVAMAAILSETDVERAETFGEALGVLFQITDDILDETGEGAVMGKTPGKDKAEDKLTCIKAFGMEGSKRLADEYADICRSSLTAFDKNDFLLGFIDLIRNRNK